MTFFRLLALALMLFIAPTERLAAASLLPPVSVMKAESLRPGMRGHALTVVSGRDVVSFPVEIVSVIPGKGTPKNMIMIKASGPVVDRTGGIAAGMSGSPVYINN
ncbi:MAG: SpoIVB peptidase S55 domain-containing protein, partial [Aminobacteriaceae bacterium]